MFVCIYSVCKANQGLQKDDPAVYQRQNEDLSRAISACWCYLYYHSRLLYYTASLDLHELATLIQAPLEPSSFQVYVLFFVLRLQIEKTVTVKCLYASTIVILTP